MPEYPVRKTPRAGWHLYDEGTYFVTACVADRKCLLGHIENGNMNLSRVGQALRHIIDTSKEHNPNINFEIPKYVIMPNHFHMVVLLGDGLPTAVYKNVTAYDLDRQPTGKTNNREFLATLVGGIKAACSKFAHRDGIPFRWQTRFHDRIIRTWTEYAQISDYIDNNPYRWSDDCYFEPPDKTP